METGVNRIRSNKIIHGMVDEHYADFNRAHLEKRCKAWCIGQFPYELLVAMDIPFVQMENFAARCAARKGEGQFKRASGDFGYPPDICSYLMISNGCAILGGESSITIERPDLFVPRPDFLLTTPCCPPMGYWHDSLTRILNVPQFCIDMPCHYDGSDWERNTVYIERQLKDCVRFLEEMTGRCLDWDRLREVMCLIKKASRLRKDVMEMARVIPAPLSFFDMLISLAAMNVLRGTPEAVGYFAELKAEVADRVAKGAGSIANERHRLYWDHLAVYFKMRELSEKLAVAGAVVVAGYYTHSILYHEPEKIHPDRPLRTIAEALFMPLQQRLGSLRRRIDETIRMMEEYRLDGIILHATRTCRPNSLGQLDIASEVTKRLGAPSLVLEADHCDPDYYDETSVNSALDTFLDLLESNRARRLG